MKTIFNSQKGFTIVEMVLYIGLLSMFLLTFTQLLGTIVEVRLESSATSSVEQDSRFLLTRLMYDVERASTIVTPANAGNQGSSLQLTINGVDYTYSLSGANIVLTSQNTAEQLNSQETEVVSLVFRRIGNGVKDTVRMSTTIQSATVRKSGRETRSLQTTVGLR